MIRFRWSAERYFSGTIDGEVEARDRVEALEKAQVAMKEYPDNYGGNVKTDSLRLTHQKRPNNKKWKELPKG